MMYILKYTILCLSLIVLTHFTNASILTAPDFTFVEETQRSSFKNDTIRFGHYNIIVKHQDTIKQRKASKLIAIAADLLTGPLGGHRIYLGTKPYVPVVYAMTLGGGMGFLPVADLFVIIFTRNLGKYCDNPQIIMWL
ncbi:MAG: hypothetical protein U9N51_04160 [Bacteroidota bacterium]|nr:hypothetical protein [Bacteroidota bacterium]